MELTNNWSYPTAIRFGAGRIAEIAEACAQAGITKPLLDRPTLFIEIIQRVGCEMTGEGVGQSKLGCQLGAKKG